MSIEQKRCRRQRRTTGQAGFTLVEVMVSLSVGLLVLLALIGIFMTSTDMADVMVRRTDLSGEARLMFNLMADGAFRDADASSAVDATNPLDRIPGFRGSKTWTAGTWALSNWTWDGAANNAGTNTLKPYLNRLRLSGPQGTTAESSTSTASATCSSHADCSSGSEFIGYLYNKEGTDNALVTTDKSQGRVVDVELQLVRPEYMEDNVVYTYPAETAYRAIRSNLKEGFRTSFYLNVDY